ncbi:hypothetical protein OIO90_005226 [Microbotryomycetes sp. JL221]|nr:hypothetical protein OIO90_005226 [Microbotryomycetes sp. JL221]
MSTSSTPEQGDVALRLSTSTSQELETSITTASQLLQQDNVVAFPTETVYGLGANALSPTAVTKIYQAKGRPSDNPLIVHVSNQHMLKKLLPNQGETIPSMLKCLMKEFWPGPLTIIFPISLKKVSTNDENEWIEPEWKVATQVSAGLDSLAIRIPKHSLALELIEKTGLPLAAPSANLSSRPSPTTSQHVWTDLGQSRGVSAILDGGECQVGLESTVVDYYVEPRPFQFNMTETNNSEMLTAPQGRIRVLRAGGISPEQLTECLKRNGFGTTTSSSSPSSTNQNDETTTTIQVYNRDFKSKQIESKPTTPGMKYKHYSPTNSRVVLVKPEFNSTMKKQQDENESDLFLPTLQDLISFSCFSSSSSSNEQNRFRIGLMLTDETLSSIEPTNLKHFTNLVDTMHVDKLTEIKLPPTTTKPQDIPIPIPTVEPLIVCYKFGSRDQPQELARNLFSGLRCLDELEFEQEQEEEEEQIQKQDSYENCVTKQIENLNLSSTDDKVKMDKIKKKGVDIILLESIDEKGLGLAVMERARKAAGTTHNGQGMSFRL